MKKSIKRVACLLLSAMTAFSLVGCGDEEDSSTGGSAKTYDTETRPVVFATEALDGNFNPFFATSGTDTEMISMTQIGMLSSDENGNIAYGNDQPCVTLDYKETVAEDQSSTEYEFIIKKGIKFSDGVELTIKDVLFNLYVYLDPAYMGSATMYSTDIVGLKRYRAQDPNLQDDSAVTDSTLSAGFYADALARKQNILDYLDKDSGMTFTADEEAQIKEDIELVKELFQEEVESDWTANAGTQEGYKDEYTFTEDWEIYYFVEGLVTVWTVQGKGQKDENGKYITSLTPAGVKLEDGSTYDGSHYNAERVEGIQEAMSAGTTDVQKEKLAKEFAIKTVYESYTTIDSQIMQILNFWATGANILDKFAAEARTEYYEGKKKDGKLVVETISGITTGTTTTDFKGNEIGAHDVLKIKINGIDPKAKYNFAFAVAPMHYYSNETATAKADGKTYFGVEFSNNTFFEEVLQADAKNALPVGAGVYKASTWNGQGTPTGNTFYADNFVYFERNTNFETVGGDEITNAKIKYLHYKVVNSDKLMEALKAKNIDVGEPNATEANINAIKDIAHLNQKTVTTNGYGYVGINPKYVPDIEVRRAIMMAFDPIHCLNYYSEKYASIIYRSMSKESWAYPKDAESYYGVATSETEILNLVKEAGWTKASDGKLKNSKGEVLKFTFTIAGATTDHPAATMFSEAADFLNKCGFDITVTTDVSALKKLATGQLEVWAAAWSSTVDPDMYQVYHKDSKATSVNNWGYPTILNDSTGQFTYEQGIIDELSTLIEEARETNVQSTRAEKYSQALDLVMELAVEFPTYQRKDLVVYNKDVISASSLNQKPTSYAGVINEIWELDYN